MTFPTGYPEVPLLVRSERAEDQLEARLREQAESLSGEPALLSVLHLAQELISSEEASVSEPPAETKPGELWLSLAHMRQPTGYLAHLRSFCAQTDVAIDVFTAPGLIRSKQSSFSHLTEVWIC